jgi:hypothetical protein
MPEVVRRDPREIVTPDPALVPFTCPWAQDGLRRSMEGLVPASVGVKEYHIGSRGLSYMDLAEQQQVVAYWNKMVELYCGISMLPTSVTGVDTACRIIPRDV